jgi:hypothetical protein
MSGVSQFGAGDQTISMAERVRKDPAVGSFLRQSRCRNISRIDERDGSPLFHSDDGPL